MSTPQDPVANPPTQDEARRLEAFPDSSGFLDDPDWREAIDSINEAVFVHAAETGRILRANAAACRIYGYTPDQLRQLAIGDLSEGETPYAEADARRWLERALVEGPQLFEWRARAADGRRFWVEVALRAGRVAGRCFATVRDISLRKEFAVGRELAVEALRRSEERFRLLLGRMPSLAVQGCGPDGAVRYWNEASERLYGYSAAEAVGRPLADLIAPPPLRDEMRVTMHQMLATGRALPPAELQLRRKDGALVPVFSSCVVLAPPGVAPELYRLDFDLSGRKQAEIERLELERRLLESRQLESLGSLAGGVAHDFNNLLTGVLGNLELALAELPRNDQLRPLIDDAVQAAHLAAHLTQQMLAYAGRVRFEHRPIDLGALVRDQEHLLRAAAAPRATLHLALAPEMPEIEGDPTQLSRLLLNLVTNAAEAITVPPGSIEIRTGWADYSTEELTASRVAEKPAPQRFVFLEVADTGCGMDAATEQRLFEPFFSTKFAGRGLGLPVVLGIVRAHHGALFIDSAPGHGTVVRTLFPLARPPAAAASAGADNSATTEADAPALAGLVLVVDDEDSVRRIAERMGRRLGISILTAADGEAALELCRQHAASITCAVIDLTMPGMNGIECLHALRTEVPQLPAVLCSGFAEEQLTSQPEATGFAEFLQKPFSLEQFAGAVRRAATRASPG